MAARQGFWSLVHHSAPVGMMALAVVVSIASVRAGDIPPGERLNVAMDEAKLIKLPERVTTIVVGNPLIADASLQPGGLAVLRGEADQEFHQSSRFVCRHHPMIQLLGDQHPRKIHSTMADLVVRVISRRTT